MASSRLEKIGTIFSRVNGLIKSGAMKWEDRPLWYDMYQKFPPINEPRFDRPVPNMEVKSIFYQEDVLRAKYHKEVKPGAYNLLNKEHKPKTRRFIEEYNRLEAMETVPKEELFDLAVSGVQKDIEDKKVEEVEKDSLVKKFKEANEAQRKKLDLANIMKDE